MIMPWLRRFTLVRLALLATVGFETASFPPGASMSDVEGRLGRPPSVVRAPGGDTVWLSAPNGSRTYMADFGPDQRLKRFYQALTIEQFAKIRIGMPEDEIRLLFGPPGRNRISAASTRKSGPIGTTPGGATTASSTSTSTRKTHVVAEHERPGRPAAEPDLLGRGRLHVKRAADYVATAADRVRAAGV